MGKKSAPPPPDYKGAAQETAQGNIENTAAQTWANRPNVTTPWGGQTWESSSTIDPSTGKPVTQWDTNITLTPEQQQALDSQQRVQMGLSQGAEGLLGQATDAFSNPMDWGSLPERGGSVSAGPLTKSVALQKGLNGSSSDYRQRAQDAITELQRPDLERSRAALDTQLANQGITKGSEAYDAEMRRQSDSEARAHLAAIDSGRAESQLQFGQDLSSMEAGNKAAMDEAGFGNNAQGQSLQQAIQAGGYNTTNRQSAIGEDQQRRASVLNELNALLNGQQVNNPNQPQFNQAGKAAGADVTGAMNGTYGAQMDQFNAEQQNRSSTQQGLGTAAMLAMMYFSDLRLKENLVQIGVLSSGIKVYEFNYRAYPGIKFTGVIAQEVMEVMPSAVHEADSGFLMVDYSKVMA